MDDGVILPAPLARYATGIFPTTGWARPQWQGQGSLTSRTSYKEGACVDSCTFILPPPRRPSNKALVETAHEFQTSRSELLGLMDSEATPATVALQRSRQAHAGVGHSGMAGGFLPTTPRRKHGITLQAAEARLHSSSAQLADTGGPQHPPPDDNRGVVSSNRSTSARSTRHSRAAFGASSASPRRASSYRGRRQGQGSRAGQSILGQSGSSSSHWNARPPKGRPPPTFGFGLASTPYGEPVSL
eukprot:COSAG05_NODE_26_length_29797_cov_35.911139_12_plen_244_part_00